MNQFPKPTVYASKCLGFDTCRYNGVTICDDFIEKLKPHVTYVTECPEKKIGLGIPRDPVRIVLQRNERRLVQPATLRDLTQEMQRCCTEILDSLPGVDGFILKSRSPSCGTKDTRYFPNMERSVALGKGAGFFGEAVLTRFPKSPIEDDVRLKNSRIREHFLTRLFTLARFRMTPVRMKALVAFHTTHKLLIMAYNQKEMRILGSLVDNQDQLPVSNVFGHYRIHLLDAMIKPARYTANINVLIHAFGYFSKHLTGKEKDCFFTSLDLYRDRKIPLSTVLGTINAWIARFKNTSLTRHVFFQPYPETLFEIKENEHSTGKTTEATREDARLIGA